MKNNSNGVIAKLPALLVMGGLAMAMQVSVAQTRFLPALQTQPLSVGEDAGVREQPASSTAVSRTSQIQAPTSSAARLAPSNVVKAPPRPLASDKVVIGVGLNPVELKRQKKAHNADKVVKKDPTRDDSLPVRPSPVKK